MQDSQLDSQDLSIQSETIEFLPVVLYEEIKRGALFHKTCHCQSSTSHRIYVADEKKKLPLGGQNYLLMLEREGYITTLQREWIIESLIINLEKAGIEEVSIHLMIATVFVVLILDDSLENEQMKHKIFDMQEVSLTLQ